MVHSKERNCIPPVTVSPVCIRLNQIDNARKRIRVTGLSTSVHSASESPDDDSIRGNSCQFCGCLFDIFFNNLRLAESIKELSKYNFQNPKIKNKWSTWWRSDILFRNHEQWNWMIDYYESAWRQMQIRSIWKSIWFNCKTSGEIIQTSCQTRGSKNCWLSFSIKVLCIPHHHWWRWLVTIGGTNRVFFYQLK